MCKRYARTVVINDILVFKENIYGIGFDFFALIFILLSYFFTYLQWYKEKMKTKSLIFALFFIIESNFCIMAQVSYGGRPFTLNNVNNNTYLKSLQTKNIVYLSYINNEREKFLADSICTMNGIAKQKFYGKGIDLDINIKDKTSPILLENGNKLWLYNIRSANAYAMQFYFDRFKLPKGATLFFYNEEKDMIQSYELGVNSYIVKPVEFDKFMEAVNGLGMHLTGGEAEAAVKNAWAELRYKTE